MHVASLKAQALKSIVDELCTRRDQPRHRVLIYQLRTSTVEVYADTVLREIVRAYPHCVDDFYCDLLCKPSFTAISLKDCIRVSLESIRTIVNRCLHLRSLDLSGCNQLFSDHLASVLSLAPHLQQLELNHCSTLTDNIFHDIISKCKALEALACESCSRITKLSCSTVERVKLKTLNLSGCQNLSNTFLHHINAFYELNALNLSWTNLDSSSLLFLSDLSQVELQDLPEQKSPIGDNFLDSEHENSETVSNYLRNICAYCTQEIQLRNTTSDLQSIDALYYSSYEDYDVIDSQVVNLMQNDTLNSYESFGSQRNGTFYPQESFTQQDWDVVSVTDVATACSCQHMSISPDIPSFSPDLPFSPDLFHYLYPGSITALDISNIDLHNETLSKKFLEIVICANPHLQHFSVSWDALDDDVLCVLGKNTNLQTVSLVDCIQVSDRGLTDLIEGCSRLECVNLRGVMQLTSYSLLQLFHKHTHIRQLTITLDETCPSDLVLTKIAQCLNESLEHLDLSWCESLHEESLQKLISSCTKLAYLDLRGCEVGQGAIKALTEHARDISVLGLCSVKDLNDVLCIPLLQSLSSSLHTVDLSWNGALTDQTFNVLLSSCPHINEVIASGLKKITCKPFLPIVPSYTEWVDRCERIRLRIQRKCAALRLRDTSRLETLAEDFYIPFRSANYAPNLHKLSLGYCSRINDVQLSEVVAVCRGTLVVEDYYGESILPRWEDVVKVRNTAAPC